MDTTKQIQTLTDQINKLRGDLGDLTAQVNKNSFSSSQIFIKDVSFLSRLQVPVFSSAPTVSQVGDLICVGGKLYVCTVANTTFTLVGSQT